MLLSITPIYTFLCCSSESVHLLSESSHPRGERHVHEFRLGVHLKTTKDGGVNLILDSELLALVLWVGLKGSKHLRLLSISQLLG